MICSFIGSTYNATASHGQTITFSREMIVISVQTDSTGIFWVRPRSVGDTTWTPASPIPSANTVADGWTRLDTGQGVKFGTDFFAPSRNFPADFMVGLDVWCEADGYLTIAGQSQ